MASNKIIEITGIVTDALDQLRVTHAVTGSLASSVHGEPSGSLDVDICLRLTADQAIQLARSLPDRFYRSEEALVEAARVSGLASLVDLDSEFKVDLSVVPREPFFDSVLARRRRALFDTEGHEFWVVSAEDIILMKLLWRKDTRSLKQWDNALSVARTLGARMDWRYLRDWAAKLGLADDLERMSNDAGIGSVGRAQALAKLATHYDGPVGTMMTDQDEFSRGALYECSLSSVPGCYRELLCCTDAALAARLKYFRLHENQAVLFIPPSQGQESSGVGHDEGDLLTVLGLASDGGFLGRYSRVLIAMPPSDGGTQWMIDQMRRRTPQLFAQFRVFAVTYPPASALTYESFAMALGMATPIGMQEPAP